MVASENQMHILSSTNFCRVLIYQAVVQYMEDFVAKRDGKVQQPEKRKGFWSRLCCFFSSDTD